MVTTPHTPQPDDDDPANLPVEPDFGDGSPGIPAIPDDPEHDRLIDPR